MRPASNGLDTPPHPIERSCPQSPQDQPRKTHQAATPTAPSVPAPAIALAVAQAVDVLDQLDLLVRSLSTEAYAKPCPRVFGSSVGKHTRHVLDHFAALLATGPASADRLVDYDHRERETRVESDPGHARAEIRRLRDALSATNASEGHQPVTVRAMVGCDGRCADLASTFARELAFASHHAFHHQAMIRLIAEDLDAPIDPAFGKAPSTLHHEHAQAAACSPTPPGSSAPHRPGAMNR